MRNITRTTTTTRPGFTLVELLVSMALIMFIMAILSQAFVTGMDTFRDMKAAGDMEEKMRSAVSILRRDLAADHFESRRHLSDPNFWSTPVREGFFRIDQGSKPFNPPVPPTNATPPVGSMAEGTDLDGNWSFRAPNNLDDTGTVLITDPLTLMGRSHRLHFTAKLRGNRQDKYFTATGLAGSPVLALPTNFFNQPPDSRFQDPDTYSTPWAEIGYVLRYTDQAGSTPLFALYRIQRAIVPDNRALNWPTYQVPATPPQNVLAHQDLAWTPVPPTGPPQYLHFLSPSDEAGSENTMPQRASLQSYPGSMFGVAGIAQERGVTLLLTDVISFDVRVLKYRPANGNIDSDFSDVDVWYVKNGTQPNSRVELLSRVFDTNPYQVALANPAPKATNAVSIMKNTIIKAIQISVRVWDAKTQQTRQVTIVQDL